MAIPIQVINPKNLPCDCMTPPFKCVVNTLSGLPPCATDGAVYTVLSDPEFCGPFQVHCRNGAWYALIPRSVIYGKYTWSDSEAGTVIVGPDIALPVPIDTVIEQNRNILTVNGSGYPVMQVPAERDLWVAHVWANINTPIGETDPTRGSGSAHLYTSVPIGQVQWQANFMSMITRPTVTPWQFPNTSHHAHQDYPNAPVGAQLWPIMENETDQNLEVGFFGCSLLGYDYCPKPVALLLP